MTSRRHPNRPNRRCPVTGLTLILASLGAQAALLGRLPATPGGTDYQAYYDDSQDITWLADGNLAATHAFGVSGMGISTSGPATMTWNLAHEWIAAMNAANYLGVSDWRLPAAVDTDGPDPDELGNDGCNYAYTGTDCGYNMDPASGELAHLYYVTLGNIGAYDVNGVHQDCDTGLPAPPACLTNVGPFSNFLPNHYWTGLDCPAAYLPARRHPESNRVQCSHWFASPATAEPRQLRMGSPRRRHRTAAVRSGWLLSKDGRFWFQRRSELAGI